jgi:hypothetical protein
MVLEINLCLAAGIDISKMIPMDIYLTGGQIIKDEELTTRAERFIVGGVLPNGSRAKALAGMSAAEKAALRARIGAR